MKYLPFVALAVLLGYGFGWQVPAVIALVMAILIHRGRRTGFQPHAEGSLRTLAELFGFALLGSIVGGTFFGGLGAIFGFVGGLIVRLMEIPITVRR